MAPEFSRKLVIERIPPGGQEEVIEATPEEREALARRFDLPAVHSVRARFNAQPWQRGGIVLAADVEADVEQTCVITLERFPVHIEEQGERYYLAENAPGRHPTVLSVESLDEEEPETIAGGAVDIGEVASEMLGLALDPYPRKPGVVFESQDGETEGGTDAFAALRHLKKQ